MPPHKLCFVTVGATASFDALVRAILDERFLRALEEHGYTELRIQYGKDVHNIFPALSAKLRDVTGVQISGFGFKEGGLDQEMRDAKGLIPGSDEGLVISHAGSGSILAALRMAVPIVVVPNSTLLDNHQLELAEELARQGYVVHGDLNDLPGALKEAEVLRQNQQAWPNNDPKDDPTGRGLIGVMDDEMGFLD